jgi:EmrB/QacA subfamily drug resistance transporter
MSDLEPKRRLLILSISCLSLFMIGVDDTIVSIALPTIARGLHASVSGLQWIVDGYTMVLASLLIFGGATADRFGRRRVFRIGLAIFTLGSALCSVAPSLGWLIAFRVLQAVGGSMLNPVAVSIISGVYVRPRARAQAISVWVGMYGLGMATGPALGGILIAAVGWRGIFWVNIPIGLCAIALTARIIPESRAERPRHQDPFGQFLVIVMLASLFWAIIEGAYTNWHAIAIRGLFIWAVALLPVLIAWELRRREPLIELRSFRSTSLSAAVVIAICAFADLGGFLFLTSIYLQNLRGLSVLDAGLHMLPTAVAMTLCPSAAAWLTARTGSARLPLVLGGLVLMLSMSEFSQLSATTSTVRLLVTFGLFGVGMGLVNSQISVAAVAGMPAGQAGLASGIASASRQLGQALGVAVAGSLLTARAGSLAGASAAFGMATYPAWHLLFGGACLVTAAGLVTRRARPRHGVARGFLGVGRARSERHARTGELPRAVATARDARGSGLGVDSGSVFTFDHEEGAADHASQL